jgi:hypothetical protein
MKIKSNIAISDNGFMFDPYSGDSYNLNPTAVEIIKLLKEGKTKEEIISFFIKKYDVDSFVFEQNLDDFLSMLGHYDLVEKQQ